MSDDIVERLRTQWDTRPLPHIMFEAADEIERLRALNHSFSAQILSEQADNEELREALRICDEAITGHLSFAWSAAEAAVQLREARMKARAALKDK
jgi:hypothetical protein